MALSQVTMTDVTAGVLASSRLYPTFNSISVELRYTSQTGHDDTKISGTLQYRPTGSSTWLPVIRPWNASTSTDKALLGKVHNLTSATSYDILLTVSDATFTPAETDTASATVSTRTEPALPNTLVPTHYISPSGNDLTGAGTLAAPWKTILKAVASAPANAVVQMAPGEYVGAKADGLIGNTTTARNNITFVAQNQAVRTRTLNVYGVQRTVAEPDNEGQRSYIVPRGSDHGPAIYAPTGAADADLQTGFAWNENGTARSITVNRIAPWVQVQCHGVVNTTTVYTCWRVRGAPQFRTKTLAWHATRNGPPHRMNHWDGRIAGINTPQKWVEGVLTGVDPGIAWGFWSNESTTNAYNLWNGTAEVPETTDNQDVYVILRGDERDASGAVVTSPNQLWWTLGGSFATTGTTDYRNPAMCEIYGNNVRLSGVEIRPSYYGVNVQQPADNTIIDHCLLRVSNRAIQTQSTATVPNVYPTNTVVEYNLMQDNYLSSVYAPGALVKGVPWLTCKSTQTVGAAGSVSRPCFFEENAAVFGNGMSVAMIIRRNTIGYFFDIMDWVQSASYDRYNGFGADISENLFGPNADDTFDMSPGSCISIFGNRISNIKSFVSIDANGWGPVYIFNNEVWRMASHSSFTDGLGHLYSAANSLGGPLIKYGGTATPASEVWFINNTFWGEMTVPANDWDFATNAAGGSNPPFQRYRNNVIRASNRVMFYSGGAPANYTFLDDDYNAEAAAGGGSGYIQSVTSNLSTLAAYRAAGFGTHDNPHGGELNDQASLDAQLVNPRMGDLRTRSDSALVSTGTVIDNITPASGVNIGVFTTPTLPTRLSTRGYAARQTRLRP